jgi:hypothetical protein
VTTGELRKNLAGGIAAIRARYRLYWAVTTWLPHMANPAIAMIPSMAACTALDDIPRTAGSCQRSGQRPILSGIEVMRRGFLIG